MRDEVRGEARPSHPSRLAEGLTEEEAAARPRRDGPNRLPVSKGPPALRQLAEQLIHFFALMLWVAGGLAFLAGLPELGVAVFLVILVNALFAFAQEYRAERAAATLRDLLPRKATVIRQGKRLEVDASELVVGDVVVLDAGDRISADIRIREAHALLVDTSAMTGESVPTAFTSGEMVFAGTFTSEGEGTGTVIATGDRTRLAGIARLAERGRRPAAPLAIELSPSRSNGRLHRSRGRGSLLRAGAPPRDSSSRRVRVRRRCDVALVPEALLPTVTLSLAVGAQRMARRNALVRRLESVETLGSTTFICTDKTGTLTRNEMSVVEAWTPAGTAEISGSGYANVQRFLTYHLTDNVAEVTPFIVWALSAGRFPLALGVLQILALDLGTDTLSATALGAEVPEPGVLTAPPSKGRLLDRAVARRAFGVLGPVEAAMTMLAFLVSLAASGWRPGDPFPTGAPLLSATGAAFATVVIAQTANAFACRSATQPPGRLGWWTNRLLVGGAAIEIVIASCFLFVPAIATKVGHASPSIAGWAVALSSAGVVLAADAAQKRYRRRSIETTTVG